MPAGLQGEYDEWLAELTELAELWLERRAGRIDNGQVDRAMRQVDRESRKVERKLRKAAKR